MTHQKFWKKYYKTLAAEQEALMLNYMLFLSNEGLISFWNNPSGLEGHLGDFKTKGKKIY